MSKFLEIPTMWEELTADQFAFLLKLVHDARPDDVTIGEILLKFSDYLLGEMQIIVPERRIQYYMLVEDISKTMDWIFTREEDGNYVLDFSTTQNLLPEISGLLGPQSHGSDLTFGEYRSAVDMMNRFTKEKEKFFLDALCGILYRKSSPVSDEDDFHISRTRFNKHHVPYYAKNFESTPDHLKWGVYLWFAYLNRYLIEGGQFIIEGNTLSFESLFNQGHSEEIGEVNLGLMSIVFTLADAGTFGNAEQTDDTLLFPILMKLLNDKQMAEKLRRNDRS